jgi:putative transcriptional regulator
MEHSAMNQDALRAELAAAYAAGALDGAMTLFIEAQAGVAPPAARVLGLAEAISGALFEAETPTPLAPDALERVFAKIVNEPAEAAAMRAVLNRNDALLAEISTLPALLQDAAIHALSRRKWRRPKPGVCVLDLDAETPGMIELVRVEPGVSIPKHTHEGREYTLVLTGAFDDGRARFGVGDICFADPDVQHRPRAETGEVCWNLAVTYGSLKFSGVLGLAQRLLN